MFYFLLGFLFYFSSASLSSNIKSIFVDSNSLFSNETTGSFENPFQNLSQAFNYTLILPENADISIFLKNNKDPEKSVYVYSDLITLDLNNSSKLSICSYSFFDVNPPENCSFITTNQSSYVGFITKNEILYPEHFLAFIFNGDFNLINLNIFLNFENPKIGLIFELFRINLFIFNCSLNIENIGTKMNNPLINGYIFFSLINSNLTSKSSTIFNIEPMKDETRTIIEAAGFILFFSQYIQSEINIYDSFEITLDSCEIRIQGNNNIIKLMNILEIYGGNKMSIKISNNKFIGPPNSQILQKNTVYKCSTLDRNYVFSIKIQQSKTVTFCNNTIDFYEFNKECLYKSLRIEVVETEHLFMYNENYKNLIIYMIFSNVQSIFMTSISISTNGSELDQRKYIDDNYILLYINDYVIFLMDTFIVYNYAISKSLLIEFEPSEFGNYTLLENVILEKTSGAIYFLFEPNIYLKSFDYDKKIDITSCSFTDLFNGGLILSGLIETSITYVKIEKCFFFNMSNKDSTMQMKSMYYLSVPLIFIDSLTAKDITLQNITVMCTDHFIGDFINIMLNTSPGVLTMKELYFVEINSKDIISFVFVQAPQLSKTDIYFINSTFENIMIKNNLMTIRCLNAEKETNETASALLFLANVIVSNINQSDYDCFNINEWDLNIYFIFYFYYPKIYLKGIKISSSIFSFRDHNIVLSALTFIEIHNFIVKDLKIKYGKKTNSEKSGSKGHFILAMPFNNKPLKINIYSMSLERVVFFPRITENQTFPCGIYQFFIFIFSLKNTFIFMDKSHFSYINGFCQIMNIFSFSEEFLIDKIVGESSLLKVDNSVFKNIIGYIGSVVYCEKGSAIFSKNLFMNNEGYKGGVIYAGSLCNLTIKLSKFSENFAKYGRILALESVYDNFKMNLSKIKLKNNIIYETSLHNSENSSGLFYLSNADSFKYDCSFKFNQSNFKIILKCKSFAKKQIKNVFHFNFAKYFLINKNNFTISSKNFSQNKKISMIDISLFKPPQHLNNSENFNLSFAFSFEFSFNKTLIQTHTHQTYFSQNIYNFKNLTKEQLNSNHFSLLAYSNIFNGLVRCPTNNCFSFFILVNMNECNMGSIYTRSNQKNKCSECKQSYILPYEADQGKCLPCPVFANCENGIIYPKEGFWRSNNLTDKIFYCLGEMNNCLGGIKSQCNKGYRGALCKACDTDNGYFSGISGSCGICPSSFSLEVFFFWLEFLIFFLIEVYVVYSDSSCLIEHEKNNFGEMQKNYSKKDQVSRLGNMLFTYLQIVSLLHFFQINLPEEIFSFADFFVNPNNGIMYSQYCLVNSLNFPIPLIYSNLMVYIFTSLIRLILLVIIWNIIGRRRTRTLSIGVAEEINTFVNLYPETMINENLKKSFLIEFKQKTSLNYSYLSFIGWFLIENIMVLKEVFLIFCVKIDGKQFVSKDFNYQCDDEYFTIYLPYLIYPVILIYGVIIPLFLYGSVVYNRKKLQKNEILTKFGPLYLAVKPKYFYWSFVNYLLKFSIIIIGVFGFVDPVKIVALLIVLIIYSGVVYMMQPYIFHGLNRLEIICCWIFVVTLTFSQTQILSNIYVSLKYLNYEQTDFHWISTMGYIVIVLLNFGFAGFLVIKILILISQRVRRYVLKFYRYFLRSKELKKEFINRDNKSEWRDSNTIFTETTTAIHNY